MSKSRVFTNVTVILSDEDPNNYHKDKDDFDSLTIVTADGKKYGVGACPKCGMLSIGEVIP